MKVSPDGEIFVLGDFLKFKVAFNSGIAFGIPINYYFLVVIYVAVLIGLVWAGLEYYNKKEYLKTAAILVIVLGASSNLIDRLTIGKVIDYIDVKYYSVLNLADVMIVVGVFGLIILSYRPVGDPPKRDKVESDTL